MTQKNKVIQFISSNLGVPIHKITLDSKIETSFGIAGLDTLIFYDEFFTTFEIVNPEDFSIDDYITPEGVNLFLALKSLFSKSAREQFKTKDISVRHLVKIAETKQWTEETLPL